MGEKKARGGGREGEAKLLLGFLCYGHHARARTHIGPGFNVCGPCPLMERRVHGRHRGGAAELGI